MILNFISAIKLNISFIILTLHILEFLQQILQMQKYKIQKYSMQYNCTTEKNNVLQMQDTTKIKNIFLAGIGIYPHKLGYILWHNCRTLYIKTSLYQIIKKIVMQYNCTTYFYTLDLLYIVGNYLDFY